MKNDRTHFKITRTTIIYVTTHRKTTPTTTIAITTITLYLLSG